jgi:Chlorophyll A-B binding protein
MFVTIGHFVSFTTNTSPGVTIMTSSTKTISSNNDRNGWRWGFTPQAESWNGRLAMIGFVAALLTELFSSQGVLHFWNLMETITLVK